MVPTNRVGSGWSARLTILLAMAITAVGIPWSAAGLAAQAPMSASLARVLAETADRLRDGRPHWIVADPRPPHNVLGVFPTDSLARARLVEAVGFRVFGPFLSEPLLGLPPNAVFLKCKHMLFPIASQMEPYCPFRIIRWDDLLEMSLTFRTATDTVVYDLKRDGSDAVFLTASSIEKFVLPYYARIYGPAYAKTMWDSVTARAARLRP